MLEESSFEIKHTSSDVRAAEKKKKIDKLTQKGSTEGERKAASRKAGVSLPRISSEELNLVNQILDEVKTDGKVHNCKKGHYWCYEDKKCKKVPNGWHVGRGGYLARDQEDSEDTESKNGNGGNGNGGNGNGGSNGGGDAGGGGGGVGESVDILDANGKKFAEIIDLITVDDLIPVISEKRDGKSAKDSDYSLKDWFKGGGWVQTGGKYDGKPCAKQPGQTTKPYCRDADDRAAMTKDERKKRAAKKRREDPDADRKGKAKIVTQESSNEKDHEFEMARRQLATMKNSAKKLEKKMGKKGEGDLKAWVQSKITKAADYIDTAADYVTNEELQLMTEEQFDEAAGEKDACYHKVKARYSVWPSAYASGALVKCRKKGAKNWGNKTKKEEHSDWRSELSEKCWPGYEKKGMKTMFGKRYPNCVKKTKTRKEELELCPVCGQDPCQCLEGNVTEAMRLNTKTGNVLMVVSYWRGKSYTSKLFFPQVKLPSKMEVTDEMQKIYPGCKVIYFRASDVKPGEALLTVLNKEEYEITEGKREENARRFELAKKHGIDMTKPGSRAKLSRLMNADTRSKNRKAKGDDRTDKEVRKDRVDDRKAFDRERKSLEYEKKSKSEIKKSLKKFRDEVRSGNDPAKAPPTREKVKVQVGTKVDKPADAPKTGRNKPTATKRAERKSYEAQQRRNAKEEQNEDWQKVNKSDNTDGMSKKAVAAYRRENPGSKLKTAVTGKVKKGSKDSKRRKSFCARSKGQQDMHNIDCKKTPNKPVCKARRRWKC